MMKNILKTVAVMAVILPVTLTYGQYCPCGVLQDTPQELETWKCALIGEGFSTGPDGQGGYMIVGTDSFIETFYACKTGSLGGTWSLGNFSEMTKEQGNACVQVIIDAIPACKGYRNPF